MLALRVIQLHSLQMQDISENNILWEDQVQTLDTFLQIRKMQPLCKPRSSGTKPDDQGGG